MRGITKRFGAFTALDQVDFSATSGQIQALVGENGAGKTTLMRVLYGLYQPNEGELLLDGHPVTFRNPKQALAAGIGMVSQHYAIIPELTCLQNLVLGDEPGEWMNLKAAEDRAQGLADQMGFSFQWSSTADSLGPAGCQKLEILKLLWRNTRIMILDEPTAMLSPVDADALFGSLNQLVESGATIILVTHRLPEVMDYCKEVTVLRSGKKIISCPTSTLDAHQLAEHIVGKSLLELAPKTPHPGAPLLQLKSLSVKGDRGDLAIKNIDFELREGEVVGIAGVDGNGQRELFQTLMGVRATAGDHGAIQVQDETWDSLSPAERLNRGLRLIAEDRHEESVIEDWSLAENAILGFQRLDRYRDGWKLNRTLARTQAQALAERFETKFRTVDDALGDLSGGNQQRFVAARALSENPKLLLAFQPTRGLDIQGTRQVYQAIQQTCESGAAALVVSFDLDELLEFCDRVVVMNHGSMFIPQTMDKDEIGRLMVGIA